MSCIIEESNVEFTGRFKYFNEKKNYGFIEIDDYLAEIFVIILF